MIASKPEPAKRLRARPRWGWCGVDEIKPLPDDGSLDPVLDLLPRQSSSREQLVGQLLALGGRYYRYLHQDEFGPTRAERSAALRTFSTSLDALLCLMSEWRGRRPQLGGAGEQSIAQRTERGGALEPLPAIEVSEVFLRLDELVSWELDAQKEATGNDAVLLERLRAAAEKAALLFELLDSTTSGDLFIMSVTSGKKQISKSYCPADHLSSILAQVFWIRDQVGEVLKLLRLRKGPDTRTSLPLLVWKLCGLWRRETGLDVTSSAFEGRDYTARPRSAAGQFVWAAVEALQPSTEWLEVHASAARSISASLSLRKEFGRAAAVNTAMNNYVAHHPSPSRRGRR